MTPTGAGHRLTGGNHGESRREGQYANFGLQIRTLPMRLLAREQESG